MIGRAVSIKMENGKHKKLCNKYCNERNLPSTSTIDKSDFVEWLKLYVEAKEKLFTTVIGVFPAAAFSAIFSAMFSLDLTQASGNFRLLICVLTILIIAVIIVLLWHFMVGRLYKVLRTL